MSVINKMLRDLDHRQTTMFNRTFESDRSFLQRGTISVAPLPMPFSKNAGRFKTWVWATLALLVLAALGAWLWNEFGAHSPSPNTSTPINTSATPATPLASPPDAPAALPIPALPAVQEAVPTVAVSPTPTSTQPPATQASPSGTIAATVQNSVVPSTGMQASTALKTPLPQSTPVPPTATKTSSIPSAAPSSAVPPTSAAAVQPSVPATVNKTANAVNTAQPLPHAAPAITRPSANTTDLSDVATLLQRQQQAGRDALAQAQSLWNNGSQEAAADVLQQAVVTMERMASASHLPSSIQLLGTLVRELARMQVELGRTAAMWDLMVRLEPLLTTNPDMWAIRANLAQRLGRHQDSVNAYGSALQLRPGEVRWLLGSAVSLAAMGQISSAAEMAEKARLIGGTIPRDVQAYLRQMGVLLKE